MLIGTGASSSVRVNNDGKIDEKGEPLIPDVAGLTNLVLKGLDENDLKIVKTIARDLGANPTIERILTRIRMLSQAIGTAKLHGLDSQAYKNLVSQICANIGKIVASELPEGDNPFTELVAWIGGTHREHPIEIFTPNYDLLIEEAFERAHLPYFDGFSGSHEPFFDSASVASDDLLPARWSRIWKIHGSLGWKFNGNTVVRTGSREATELIYPEYLKYDQITRQPYSALFERLRIFLGMSDSLLLCSGFSFSDAHITTVLDEALSSNASAAILAFQHKPLNEENSVAKLARRHSNMSVYTPDGAIICQIQGKWKLESTSNDEWENIRRTFWKTDENKNGGQFLLGDFAKIVRFFALAQSSNLRSIPDEMESTNSSDTAPPNVAVSVEDLNGKNDA